jgi:glutaredoxin
MKKVFFGIFFSFLLLITFKTVSAQENEIIFFYSNTCPYCHDVLEVIDTYNLEESLNMELLEASQEGVRDKFYEHLELCGLGTNQAGYPTLYYNGKCSVGSNNNINVLFNLAGISSEQEIEETEEIENTTEVEEDEEEEREIQNIEIPRRSIWVTLAMFIGPIVMVVIAWLIIKKLNL